jgi:uncharacterized membrane protein
MSIPTGVDGDAPVRARHETDINAPLDAVWQLHADVNAWPAWQTDITAAHIDGGIPAWRLLRMDQLWLHRRLDYLRCS